MRLTNYRDGRVFGAYASTKHHDPMYSTAELAIVLFTTTRSLTHLIRLQTVAGNPPPPCCTLATCGGKVKRYPLHAFTAWFESTKEISCK